MSRASADVVQPQPPAGSCHARGHGRDAMPDPHCTPGAVNPAVTQRTINRTICVTGWTKTVRPPERVTAEEKLQSMAAYGDTGSPHNYEYDHLVSLELGGAVNDARNLWPEPGGSPNAKDAVEDMLHRMVCYGQMRLSRAQRIIATGWVAWARAHPPETTASAASGPGSAAPAPSGAAGGTSGGVGGASGGAGGASGGAGGASDGPNKPISEINCSDFPTHAAAERWFLAHGGSASNDVAGLDRNHDGQACTSLP